MGDHLPPFREPAALLTTIPGVSDVVAHVILAEIVAATGPVEAPLAKLSPAEIAASRRASSSASTKRV